MNDFFKRTECLIGKSSLLKLNNSHVAVFGLGGVGSYAVEALARSGVGSLTFIDNDCYESTNINRQLYATTKTLGRKKTEVCKERVLDINPDINVTTIDKFILQNDSEIDFTKFDYVIDAIDTISGKLEIIKQCKKHNVPFISCMGTGNKLDPTAFKVADIKNTKVCPLCKVMRKLLKENKIENVKVIFSEEQPITSNLKDNFDANPNSITPSSISFVPSVAGLIASGEAIKYIIK